MFGEGFRTDTYDLAMSKIGITDGSKVYLGQEVVQVQKQDGECQGSWVGSPYSPLEGKDLHMVYITAATDVTHNQLDKPHV